MITTPESVDDVVTILANTYVAYSDFCQSISIFKSLPIPTEPRNVSINVYEKIHRKKIPFKIYHLSWRIFNIMIVNIDKK